MQLIPITIIFLMIYAYTTILNKKTIYTIPLTFLTIIPFTMIFGYLKMLKHIDITIIILLIIAYIYIYRKKLYKNKQYRQEYDHAKIIQNKVRENSKIYFLDTENTPYACYLARYENINMQFSNTRYNQYIDEDVIKLYDCLFVYSYNDEFKENNKKKFDELKPFTLYKINENNYIEVANEK